MNRITVNVDLDGNEVLQDSIRSAIQGEVRQITREAFQETFQGEIDRIVKARCRQYFTNRSDDYCFDCALKKKIDESIYKQVNIALESINITPMEMHKAVGKRLEIVENFAKEQMRHINDRIDKTIALEVAKLFGSTFTSAISKAILSEGTQGEEK